ncbi:MAG: glycerophosphodiester phosphodiesterase [Pyrinomonadaceae bacterium]
MTRPLIIAHRGVSAHAPENTLAAFQLAIEVGAEGVEFDVHLARDGVPVVIHDDNLRRTGQRPERIADLTSKQLAKIDVGSWFNAKFPKSAQAEFAKETVPKLKQTLKLLAAFRGLIYIEMKADDADFRRLVSAVVDEIRSSPLLSQIIVKSFKLGAIPQMRYLLPNVQTAALFAPEIMHYLRRREHIISLAREFGAHRLSVHYSLVTPRLCKLAAAAKMPLTAWTIDDPIWIARRRNLAIGAVITNDPALLLGARK